MAIKTYFQNIADAIRAKGGTVATLTPAEMPQAIADLPSGGGGDFTPVEPLASDYKDGYVDGSQWYISANSNYRTDVYEIETPYNTSYVLTVQQGYNIVRAAFFSRNPLEATSTMYGNQQTNYSGSGTKDYLVGKEMVYIPPRYLAVTKCDNATDGIKSACYVFNGFN